MLLLVVTLATLLLLSLRSDAAEEGRTVLTGVTALLVSSVAVLDTSSDIELLLGEGADVLRGG